MVLAEAYYHDSAEQGRVWVRPDEVQVEKDGGNHHRPADERWCTTNGHRVDDDV